MSMPKGSFLIISSKKDEIKKAVAQLTNIDPFSNLSGSNPDFMSVTSPAVEQIGIEKIRQLQKFLSIKPIREPQKIAVVFEAEKLTPEAQNALLKTLEDPGGESIVILVSRSPDFLLPTIISRCRIVHLSELQERISVEEAAKLQKFFQEIATWAIGERLKFAAEAAKDRKTALEWLDKFLIATHSALLSRSNWTNLSDLTSSLLKAKSQLKANCNVRLTMENLLLNW